MEVVLKQETIVKPSDQLESKLHCVLRLMEGALRDWLGDKYQSPTRVCGHMDSDVRSTWHVYLDNTLMYSFILKQHHPRDNYWFCESDLSQQLEIAIATIQKELL